MTTSETQLFQTAILQSWNAVVITDADLATGCRVQTANPAFCRMTGYSIDELRGQPLKILQGPETDPAVIDDLRTCLEEARYFEGTTVNYRKDGSPYIVRWNISPVRDENGVLTHFVSVQQDISDYVHAEQGKQLFARALNATSDPVVITDAEARIIFANTAFAAVSGYPLDAISGKTPALFRSGKHDDAFYAELRRSLARGNDFRATFINRRQDGTLYHSEQSISPICDDKGTITHYISVSRDISERIDMEQTLRQAANQDTLTGLHNRRHGEQLLSEAYRSARTHGEPLSIIMCDIDHFKQVNDHFGHPAGDRVLSSVGHILSHAVRTRDAVIRWGGEEFLIVLGHCTQTAAAELAERIRGRVQAHHDAEVGTLTLSLGLASLTPEETAEQLVARADAALYTAKRDGRNRLAIAATK
jgi:diguanylate cyclase (GGDEF)-like protein/PAS domain S-box-containing protein